MSLSMAYCTVAIGDMDDDADDDDEAFEVARETAAGHGCRLSDNPGICGAVPIGLYGRTL